MNPLKRLKSKGSSLTKSQKLVVDYILNHYQEVGFMTIEQLSKNVGISPTTIMRLMVNVGFSGYSEFQRHLHATLKEETSLQSKLMYNLSIISKNESWTHHYDLHMKQIEKAIEDNSEDHLIQVVQMISEADNIYCTSVRAGLPVAHYLSQNINRVLGNTRLSLADSSDWADDVISYSKKDVLIVVSFSRYGRRIIDYVEQAKKRKVKVIVLTDKFSSPVIPYGDVTLVCPTNSIASHNSIVSAIFVSDYIISQLSILNQEVLAGRLTEIDSMLKEIDYHVNKKD
ncbi:MurR/RpiR family transcriptional regulator [Shouchella lehensis]|uniref:MurR/RpiR family transcriptional regulator n=1 Tax=Shouchella lehensis TaxID=300825 RepID=A0A4Y7WEC3_9BACI|nr:MurR/RpiR family transcriptional regulator [Shouchella lehensis]MBG9784747.1 transcriptional regulator [Shouchella lehensis]TES46149.1 MurR/RpiR family transcriptional regulator [Shouchella lehensis]